MADGNVNVFDDTTTQDIIAIVRQWRAGRLPAGGSGAGSAQRPFQQSLPFFTNDSGEAIPPYACMQIVGTIEIGDRNYLKVKKPVDTDGTAGAFIFNGHREILSGQEGLAQIGPVVRGFKDAGTVTGGDKWVPVAGQWYIEKGEGPLVCCGADSVLPNVLKVINTGSAGSGTQDRLFKTPGGGIPAATGSGPYTWGSAACTPVNADGTMGSGTVTIENIVNVAIAASVVIKAAKVGDIWVVDVASCGA